MHSNNWARTPSGLQCTSLFALVFAWACALPDAHAQVHRCSDSNGNVTYTDGACPNGQETVQIEAAKTPEQIAIEQQRAAEALERQAQQRQERLERLEEQRISAETAALEASARASAATEAAARAQANNPADTTACRDATRQLNRLQLSSSSYSSGDQQRWLRAQDAADRACLSPQDYAAMARERALRPATAIVINPPYGHYRPTRPPRPLQGYPTQPGLPPLVIGPPHPPPQRPMPLPAPIQRPPALTPQQPAAQSGVRAGTGSIKAPASNQPEQQR